MRDTFICTVQIPAASLLPFLGAGFDLEISAYPVVEESGEEVLPWSPACSAEPSGLLQLGTLIRGMSAF